MAVENNANYIFRGVAERLAHRMAESSKTTFQDLAAGVASDIERVGRVMFDPSYNVYAEDHRKGGLYLWTPTVVVRILRDSGQARMTGKEEV